MTSSSWEPLLTKYFMTVLEYEMQCEGIRQTLASNLDFLPHLVFSRLDIENKNFLSLNDFRAFLKEKEVNFSDDCLRKFIHNYDRDRDFAISFNELMNFLLTRKRDDLREVTLERKQIQKDQTISNEVEDLIAELIAKELSSIEDLGGLAEEIANSKDFTIYEAFLTIDTKNNKYISETSLNAFLKKNGYNFNQGEAGGILFRLDKDGDGQVSYEEYQEIFAPLRVGRSLGNSGYVSSYNQSQSQRNNVKANSNVLSSSDNNNNYIHTFENKNNNNMNSFNNSSNLAYSNSNFYQAENNNENRINRDRREETGNKNKNKNENIKIMNNSEEEQVNLDNENNNSGEGERECGYNIENPETEPNANEENDLSNRNPIYSTYSEDFNKAKNRAPQHNNYNYNGNKIEIGHNYMRETERQRREPETERYPDTERYPEQQERNIEAEFLAKSKEKLFSTTMSTIYKNAMSPLRASINDELNIRASMNTYTSPLRERQAQNLYSQKVTQNQIPENKYTYTNMNRNSYTNNYNYQKNNEDDDFSYYNYILSRKPKEPTSLGFSLSKRYFSPNRINTSINYLTVARENKSPARNRINSSYTSLSPRRNVTINANTNLTSYATAKVNVKIPSHELSPSYFYSKYENRSKSFNLANFFNDLLIFDSNTEKYRESLALKTEVNLKDLFSFFDVSSRNSISLIDLKEVLKQFNIFSTLEELKLVFKRFDVNLDGRLDFAEFCQLFIPKKLEYARLLKNRLPQGLYVEDFSSDARKNLILLFKSLIEGEVSAEHKRKLLNHSPGFSSYENYENVKGKFKSNILKEDMKNFMQDNGFFFTSLEFDILFDRLDKNQDGKISFNEFIFELVPRYNSEY